MFSFCSVKSLPRKTAKSGDKLSEDPVKVHLLRQTLGPMLQTRLSQLNRVWTSPLK